jgi:hypothetical protein
MRRGELFRWHDLYTGERIDNDEIYSTPMGKWVPIGGVCMAISWGKGMSWLAGDRLIRVHSTDMKKFRLTFYRRFFAVKAIKQDEK